MPDLLRLAAQHWGLLVTITGLVLVLGRLALAVWRAVHPLWLRTSEFLDDWTGEPERPGRDRSPGVMERLHTIEVAAAAHSRALAELRPNGGYSVKDVVDQTARRVEELAQRLDAIERVVVPDQPEGRR